MTSTPHHKKGKRKARGADSDGEDSDAFEVLLDAPRHMRKITNEYAPIRVDDDSGDEAVQPHTRRKTKADQLVKGKKKKQFKGEVFFLDDERVAGDPMDAPGPSRGLAPIGLEGNDGIHEAVGPPDQHNHVILPAATNPRLIPGPDSPDQLITRPQTPAGLALADDPEFEAGVERAMAYWDHLPVHPGPSSTRPAASAGVEEGAQATTGASSSNPLPFVAAEHISKILDILPDIDVDWALSHLEEKHAIGFRGEYAGIVVQEALELPDGYPKASEKKQVDGMETQGAEYGKKEYRSDFRCGQQYADSALAALQELFPTMPATHIQVMFIQTGSQYYPTYVVLSEHLERDTKPYTELKRPRQNKGVLARIKGKAVASTVPLYPYIGLQNGQRTGGSGDLPDGSQEWEREHAFLEAKLESDTRNKEQQAAKEAIRAAELAAGNGFECGCCFGEELMEDMFQCAEGHLFCRECSTRHAEIKLGDQSTNIKCMDGSGCPASFPEMELSRLLSTKSLALYHRLKFTSELASADIEGLETCPACDFAVVIDNPEEKLFVCQLEGCKQISCRKCRRREHLPKSCEELEADRKLDKRHAIEDAMSDALIRRCPQCSKPYMKADGCNKITCSGCRTLSCYVCQKAITSYAHFSQLPGQSPSTSQAGKCLLWDNDEARKDQEAVIKARDDARAEAMRRATEEGIELADADIDVEAPQAALNRATGFVVRPHPGLLRENVFVPGGPLGNALPRPGLLADVPGLVVGELAAPVELWRQAMNRRQAEHMGAVAQMLNVPRPQGIAAAPDQPPMIPQQGPRVIAPLPGVARALRAARRRAEEPPRGPVAPPAARE